MSRRIEKGKTKLWKESRKGKGKERWNYETKE
jgi:hypothetical protein